MKKLLLVFLSLLSIQAFSQDYLDDIAKKSCECVAEVAADADKETLIMKLGICLIQHAEPYRDQLKEDHNINFDNIEVEGERLGQLVGMRMATVCPDIIMSLAETETRTEVNVEVEVMGEITKVASESFVVFSLKDGTGKTSKYHWLSFVEADIDLMNDYTNLVGKKVVVRYDSQEFFDPKIGKYRAFKVISSMRIEP